MGVGSSKDVKIGRGEIDAELCSDRRGSLQAVNDEMLL